MQDKPLLFVDIDGVISLWAFDSNARPAGAFQNMDGVIPFLSSDAAVTCACHARSAARPAPTLLVTTTPAVGLSAVHANELVAWAAGVAGST